MGRGIPEARTPSPTAAGGEQRPTPPPPPPPARRAGGLRRQVSSGRSRPEARGPRPQWYECAGTGCVIFPPLPSLGANPRTPKSLCVSSGGNGSFNLGRERGVPEVTCAPRIPALPCARPSVAGTEAAVRTVADQSRCQAARGSLSLIFSGWGTELRLRHRLAPSSSGNPGNEPAASSFWGRAAGRPRRCPGTRAESGGSQVTSWRAGEGRLLPAPLPRPQCPWAALHPPSGALRAGPR